MRHIVQYIYAIVFKRIFWSDSTVVTMHLTLGTIIQLFSRNIYHDIEIRFSWHEAKGVSKETEDELKNFVRAT